MYAIKNPDNKPGGFWNFLQNAGNKLMYGIGKGIEYAEKAVPFVTALAPGVGTVLSSAVQLGKKYLPKIKSLKRKAEQIFSEEPMIRKKPKKKMESEFMLQQPPQQGFEEPGGFEFLSYPE